MCNELLSLARREAGFSSLHFILLIKILKYFVPSVPRKFATHIQLN